MFIASAGGQMAPAVRLLLLQLPLTCLLAWTAWVYWHRQYEQPACEMTFMYPQFKEVQSSELLGLEAQSTHGYKLYQYQDWPNKPGKGDLVTPALFVPGNAGNYQQVRCMASETARVWAAERAAYPGLTLKQVYIQWYAVDTREELAAFDGQVLERQAAFVLRALRLLHQRYNISMPQHNQHNRRYQHPGIILVGHSMGGVVARAAWLDAARDPHLGPSSIAMLLTLAAPLQRPPLPCHPSLQHFYTSRTGKGPVPWTPLISLSAAYNDSQVAYALTSPHGLHPPPVSLHVSTAAIPGVWLSPSHNVIVWCNQLLKPLSLFLTEAAWHLHYELGYRDEIQNPGVALEKSEMVTHLGDDSHSHHASLVMAAARRHLMPRALPGKLDSLLQAETASMKGKQQASGTTAIGVSGRTKAAGMTAAGEVTDDGTAEHGAAATRPAGSSAADSHAAEGNAADGTGDNDMVHGATGAGSGNQSSGRQALVNHQCTGANLVWYEQYSRPQRVVSVEGGQLQQNIATLDLRGHKIAAKNHEVVSKDVVSSTLPRAVLLVLPMQLTKENATGRLYDWIVPLSPSSSAWFLLRASSAPPCLSFRLWLHPHSTHSISSQSHKGASAPADQTTGSHTDSTSGSQAGSTAHSNTNSAKDSLADSTSDSRNHRAVEVPPSKAATSETPSLDEAGHASIEDTMRQMQQEALKQSRDHQVKAVEVTQMAAWLPMAAAGARRQVRQWRLSDEIMAGVNYNHTASWALVLPPDLLSQVTRITLWAGAPTNASSYHLLAQLVTSNATRDPLLHSSAPRTNTHPAGRGNTARVDAASRDLQAGSAGQLLSDPPPHSLTLSVSLDSLLFPMRIPAGSPTLHSLHVQLNILTTKPLYEYCSSVAALPAWLQDACRLMLTSLPTAVAAGIQMSGLTAHAALRVTPLPALAVSKGLESVGSCMHTGVVLPCSLHGGQVGVAACGDASEAAVSNLTSYSLAPCLHHTSMTPSDAQCRLVLLTDPACSYTLRLTFDPAEALPGLVLAHLHTIWLLALAVILAAMAVQMFTWPATSNRMDIGTTNSEPQDMQGSMSAPSDGAYPQGCLLAAAQHVNMTQGNQVPATFLQALDALVGGVARLLLSPIFWTLFITWFLSASYWISSPMAALSSDSFTVHAPDTLEASPSHNITARAMVTQLAHWISPHLSHPHISWRQTCVCMWLCGLLPAALLGIFSTRHAKSAMSPASTSYTMYTRAEYVHGILQAEVGWMVFSLSVGAAVPWVLTGGLVSRHLAPVLSPAGLWLCSSHSCSNSPLVTVADFMLLLAFAVLLVLLLHIVTVVLRRTVYVLAWPLRFGLQTIARLHRHTPEHQLSRASGYGQVWSVVLAVVLLVCTAWNIAAGVLLAAVLLILTAPAPSTHYQILKAPTQPTDTNNVRAGDAQISSAPSKSPEITQGAACVSARGQVLLAVTSGWQQVMSLCALVMSPAVVAACFEAAQHRSISRWYEMLIAAPSLVLSWACISAGIHSVRDVTHTGPAPDSTLYASKAVTVSRRMRMFQLLLSSCAAMAASSAVLGLDFAAYHVQLALAVSVLLLSV